jgi:hypothetical protein
MKPSCLERWDAFWTEHPNLGMAYCQRDTIDEEGNVVELAPRDETPTVLSTQEVAQISFYYGSMPGNIADVVLRRGALNEVGLFREDMQVSGDFELWVRIAEEFKTGFCDEALIYLRRHQGQLSKQSGVDVHFMEEDREIIKRLFDHLPESSRLHACRYNRWYRHVQYVHYMIRALWEGEFRRAYRIYTRIKSWDNILCAVGRWIVTANNRLKVYKAPSVEYIGSDEK